jgi:hypothetical protein
MSSIITFTYCSKWNHANGQALLVNEPQLGLLTTTISVVRHVGGRGQTGRKSKGPVLVTL